MIVNPVMSVLKDQHDKLRNIGIDGTFYINSSQTKIKDKQNAINKFINVESLFTYISADRLYLKEFTDELSKMFEEDKFFIIDLYTEVIAPSDRLYDYLEDYKLTWVDDLPGINTLIVKQIKQLKSEKDTLIVPKVYKDEDDKEFVKNLFRSTVLNELDLSKEYIDKTPNWDVERIAEIDTIILKMAICELLQMAILGKDYF